MNRTPLIGLDFDNTLISYDQLFFTCALEDGLIPASLSADKMAVRDHLRESGREDVWTRLQGEVYGVRIMEAPVFAGAFEALAALQRDGFSTCLVSHKTRVPYLGEGHDLRLAASNWLEGHGFFDEQGLGWTPDQVFFESTKAEKVARIVSLGCTHFVDDLSEVLEMLPDTITRVLFSPSGRPDIGGDWLVLREWTQLPELLR
tara:strand:+ start:2251 stop:2859 length:609 start_codon:yes stop_codon:yes gene_type:complete